ncbi:MAG: 1-(5-phosphoribosyl)-5-[(5-phosphoribosylamino)methylideneamino]imidazole-4-carboxamide isomerase [Bacteroidales bacterium]|jgi:phosphoribosylformimino-5-aminoimidazole carboxamide ribotide isomerase|nr:1-(5-phosphoribosyl)-5-[(5-phosphoribosylamino)methylideneamino]imidazole-4-carboxamide isomerase [Bacteroidales bacterium]
MRIIAAIDIIGGECVRLTRGNFDDKKVYDKDPLEVARKLEDHGLKFLHLVDLDGARQGKTVNLNILESITVKTSLKVDFGGGIRSDVDLRNAFESGASQVTCGSIAVFRPDLFRRWLTIYGADKIILGADFRQRLISISGWAESSDNDVVSFLKKYRDAGVIYSISTDIEKDGMLSGPAFDLYEELCHIEGLKIIASGGITTSDDLRRLKETGCEGAIIGKAIYEGKITLKELRELC